MTETIRTALMNDLAEVCVEGYVRDLVKRGEFHVVAPAWEDNIAEHQRDTVTALLTGSHAIDLDKVKQWKTRFPSLSMLSLAFTGTDRVKKEEIWEAYDSLVMCKVPGYATNEVAEHAVGLTLAVLRRTVMGSLLARIGAWHDGGVVPGRALAGSTVGIVGTGPIGIRTAAKFAALGCSLLAYSPKNPNKQEFLSLGGRDVSKDEIFAKCDIITLHVKSTPETYRIASQKRIESMKPEAVLINTGRGSLVDNEALAEALQSRAIFGAGIDVFDVDPIRGWEAASTDPLLSLDPQKYNIVATPHVAFKANVPLEKLAAKTLENVRRWNDDPDDTTNRLLPDSIEE